MEYSAFLKEVNAGKFKLVYLFAGKEDFLAEAGVHKLIDRLIPPEDRPMNLTYLYGDEPSNLNQAVFSAPVFAKRRVTVVRQVEQLNDRSLQTLAKFIKQPYDDSVVILWAGELDKRRKFYREIAEKVEVINCAKLRDREQAIWMREHAASFGKILDDEAIERLSTVIWPSLRDLAVEIERLALLVGDTKFIKLEDIDEMGGGSFAMERWRLTDAIASSNIRSALAILQNLMYWGTKPTQIIGDLQRLYSSLWVIQWYLKRNKKEQANKDLKLQGFLFDRYCEYARKSAPKSLEDGLVRLMEAELNIKRGLADGNSEIVVTVAQLTSSIRG